MEGFLSILLVATLAIAGTSRSLNRLRRSRPIAVLISGGWVWIAVGAAVGPRVLGAVDSDIVLRTTPLVAFALGWIGLMIGLQAQRSVLASLPGAVRRATLTDLALSIPCFGVLGWIGLSLWSGSSDTVSLAAPTALLAACGIGWSMETRSLRAGQDEADGRLSLAIRAAGGVAAIAAISVWGVGVSLSHRTEEGVLIIDGVRGARTLAVCLGLAVIVSGLARVALRVAGSNRADLLTVFVGLVAIVSGGAVNLGAPPIFAAMLTGIVLTNLPGVELRRFERFLLDAEHVVAVVLAVLAGVLLDPAIGVYGAALAFGLAALRLLTKPAAVIAAARGDNSLRAASRTLRLASVRQSPVALAVAVGFVLAEPSPTSHRLLAVVVLTGLLSELIPLGASVLLRDKPMSTTTTPDLGAPGTATASGASAGETP
ncbi:MAG: hypothetical protein ACF8QF_02065 [Phycisphaerales bacterium]